MTPPAAVASGKLLLDATKKNGFVGTMPSYPEEALQKAQRLIAAHDKHLKL